MLVGHPAVERGKADHAGQADPVPRAVDADTVPVELVAQHLGDPVRRCRRLQRKNAPPLMLEREGNIAASHRKPFHHIEAGGIFRARTAEELTPGGNLLEQALDPNAGARRQRGRALADFPSVVDLDPPSVRAARAAVESQA